MKKLKRILSILCLIVLFLADLHAQEVTTQGKEFWLSFIGNGFKYHPNTPQGWVRVQLIVSAKRNCEGTITNPNTGWTQNFAVEANNIFSVDLNEEQVYVECSEYEQIVNKGLIITTTDTVSVYCANIATYSFDASYVLPTPGLADDYIIQTYEQSTGSYDPSSAFVIVATEDNTTIDITPSVTTLGGKPAHQEFTITLDKGQAYQVRSNMSYGSRDLSGSRVTARDCKKIAIFNGNNLTLVPSDATSDSDCIFEQAMPLHSWGKKFVVTNSLDRNEDYVKITSAADGNEILKNGAHLCTLNANESHTFKLSKYDKSCYLEATHSCAVYLYNTSSNGSGNGAPSMVWIAPIEQRIDEITFSTFNYSHTNVNISKHYVNIIIESQDIGQVYLDNTLLPSNEFETVTGNDQYSFYRKQITHGVHHLSCPNGFNAHVYGFGDARGYSYMVGSKASDLSTTIVVNDVAINPNDTVTNCSLGPLTFFADINLSNYELLWDFGDGTTSTDNPVVHNYGENNLYEARLTITTQEIPCLGSTSATTTFYIDISNDLNQDISDVVCFSGPDVYTEYGFNIHYNQPGLYTDSYTLTAENGCDSIITLTLNVNEIIDEDTQHESGHCDVFEWNGNTYTEPGIYNDTVLNASGCYSIYHLDLDLDFTPNPTDIYPSDTINPASHWVVTATEFQIFYYDYALEDNNKACHWDSIHWEFENPDIHWVILPDSTTQPTGKICRIYVMEHVNDTVWLKAKVYNHCVPQGVERRYWLVSSFYDINESLVRPDFSITPNPNNGQMQLNFENLIGKIDLRIFDMQGALIDQFQINNDTNSHSFPYECKSSIEGLYFFVATWNNTVLTKKVIIFQ